MALNWRRWVRLALFAGVGALAGLAYYRFFGCTSGCVISSSLIRSMLYLALVGGLLGAATEKGGKDPCST